MCCICTHSPTPRRQERPRNLSRTLPSDCSLILCFLAILLSRMRYLLPPIIPLTASHAQFASSSSHLRRRYPEVRTRLERTLKSSCYAPLFAASRPLDTAAAAASTRREEAAANDITAVAILGGLFSQHLTDFLQNSFPCTPRQLHLSWDKVGSTWSLLHSMVVRSA